MLVRRWVEGNVEFRIERRPFRSEFLEGLPPEQKKQMIKQNRLLGLKIVDGAVEERHWSKNFLTLKGWFTGMVISEFGYSPQEVDDHLWHILEMHKYPEHRRDVGK